MSHRRTIICDFCGLEIDERHSDEWANYDKYIGNDYGEFDICPACIGNTSDTQIMKKLDEEIEKGKAEKETKASG